VNNSLIVSESNRPLMSLIVAALLFTTAIAVFVKCFVISDLSNFTSKNFIGIFNIIGFLVITGIGFCSVKKSIYRFRTL